MVPATHRAQDLAHFFDAEYDRQLLLLCRSHQIESGPFPLERMLVEEFDATQGDPKGAGGDTISIFEVEEVLAQFFLGDFIRGFVIVLRQKSNSGYPEFLGTDPAAAGLRSCVALNESWLYLLLIIDCRKYSR